GPMRPASIEYLTRKMPPSARATPPTHTTQRVPKRSSRLAADWGAASAAVAATVDAGSGSGAKLGGALGSGTGWGVGGAGAATGRGVAAAIARRSMAANWTSRLRMRSLSEAVLTSAIIAMNGNDRTSSPSNTYSMNAP